MSASPKYSDRDQAVNELISTSLRNIETGNLQLARHTIEQALAINNQHLNGNNIAGLIYGKLNEDTLAKHHFSAALNISKNDPATLNNYANYLCENNDKSKAIELFLQAASNINNPQREIAYINAGLCSLRIPDTPNAKNYFLLALEVQPQNNIALYQLAKIYYLNEQGNTAHRYLTEYSQIAQHTPDTLKLGIQISRLNKTKKLENSYINILSSRFPESAQLIWAVATQK